MWVRRDVDLAEIGGGATLGWIVGQQILGPQLVADLLERFIHLVDVGRVEVFSAGVIRHLDQGMLAAGVAPRARFHRHVDQAIDQRL